MSRDDAPKRDMTHWAPSSPVRNTRHGFHRGTTFMPGTTEARLTQRGRCHQGRTSCVGGRRKGRPGDAEGNGAGPGQQKPTEAGLQPAGGHHHDRIRSRAIGIADEADEDEVAPPSG